MSVNHVTVGKALVSLGLIAVVLSSSASELLAEEELGWKRHVVMQGAPNSTAIAADFTGDGKVDVVTNAKGKTLLYVAPDWKEVVLDAAKPARNCIHSAVMDVNGDKRPDFVGAVYSPGLIFWLECPAKPLEEKWQYHLIDDKVNGIHGLVVGDIDSDGRADLAANSAQPKGPFADSLVWYRVPAQPSTATSWDRHVVADHDAPGLSHYLGLGDVNGDGRIDVASGAKGGSTAVPGTGDWFAWWEAPADPTKVFKKHLIAADQPGATNIHMADVNGDRKMDFIATRGHGKGVLWFEGPDWKPHIIHETLSAPHCLEVADIDGDGDVDAVTCAYEDRIAAWFENDGRGKFTTHVISSDQAAYDIRLVDMDNDNDLDVLIAGQRSENVAWYENPRRQIKAAEIRPFRIRVEDAVLDDLKSRLTRTRFPDQIAASEWTYGVDVRFCRELVNYWQTTYNWRKHEQALNEIPQFVTEIDGLQIHFIHQRSKHPNALPLVVIHGWPGSVYEFHKIIEPLTESEKHGGSADDAFHVICPSLPGFGFSGKPTEPGWSSQRMAEVIAKLMARLGYDRYGAQGGDWGSGMARWLANNDGAHCIGAHSNFPGASQPTDDPMRGVMPHEIERMQRRAAELNDHRGYSTIQGTRPLALAYGLNDSPAGLAAWIVDKFWAWSDHHGNLENSFTKDELLTNVMIYWVTQSMPSSTRIYFESQHNLPRPTSMTAFQSSGKPAPLGFALFPKEINVPPRAWVERSVGSQFAHWTEMPRGGHFAALEQSQLLIDDVRKFFRTVARDR